MDDWQRFYCLTDWCELSSMFVQRYEGYPDLWYITMAEHYDSGWLIAGETPICPCCGAYLLTATNIMEGVEGITT